MGQYDLGKEKFEEEMHTAAIEKRGMIMMYEDKDGNWRGGYYKRGEESYVESRAVGPETVLQMLLTHDGK